MTGIKAYSIKFNGAVLSRGFWLYVCEIKTSRGRYLYVGRTGDSSSSNAASPFRRIGQHLDLKENAKGNSLARRLAEQNINLMDCEYELIALGPIDQEQKSFEAHRPIRDKVGALEYHIASTLRERGYKILGNHSRCGEVDYSLFQQIIPFLNERFPSMLISNDIIIGNGVCR